MINYSIAMHSVNANLKKIINQAIEKFAKHIFSHYCAHSRSYLAANLYRTVCCIRQLLLEGKKVRLDNLDDFSISLTSTGTGTVHRFSASNLTSVKACWDFGQDFKNLLGNASSSPWPVVLPRLPS